MMGIQWENFVGHDRGFFVEIARLIDHEDGTSGWEWSVGTDPISIRAHDEERFRIGDEEGKQRALTLAIEYAQGAVDDALAEIKIEEEEIRRREAREEGWPRE